MKSVREKIDVGAYEVKRVGYPYVSCFMVALSNGRWAIYDEWSPDKIMYRTYSTASNAEAAARGYCEDAETSKDMREGSIWE